MSKTRSITLFPRGGVALRAQTQQTAAPTSRLAITQRCGTQLTLSAQQAPGHSWFPPLAPDKPSDIAPLHPCHYYQKYIPPPTPQRQTAGHPTTHPVALESNAGFLKVPSLLDQLPTACSRIGTFGITRLCKGSQHGREGGVWDVCYWALKQQAAATLLTYNRRNDLTRGFKRSRHLHAVS